MLKLSKLFHLKAFPESALVTACNVSVNQTRYKSKKQCNASEKGEKGEKAGKKGQVDMCKDKGKGNKTDDSSAKGEESESTVNEIPKIAINGFGRIGRMAMRVTTEHSCPLDIVAINDPFMTTDQMAYLLKYDSTHGRFIGEVESDGKQLVVDGKQICTYSVAEPKNIPWKDLGVDYVIESSGVFKSVEKAQGHLTAGAKKVVISAPMSDDGPMYVVGANLDSYDPADKIVSSGSCSTNALAPLAKVLHEEFGIEEGIMNTVHSVTPTQKILDHTNGLGKKWRDGRSGLQNMIPSTTGASKNVGKVIPDLQGKITAMSTRVPIGNVSMVDFTCRLKKDTSLEDIKSALCEAKDNAMMGIIDVTTDQVVSSDFNGSHYSVIYDATASLALNKRFYTLIGWYDNEYGFTCRLIDLIKFMHAEELAQE